MKGRLGYFSLRLGIVKLEWEDHLAQVLMTKLAEAVQKAIPVLEKHGCYVKEMKSELYYSSTR